MASDVQSAWIAAGASIVVSMVSLATAVWTNVRAERARREQNATAAELERLKSSLSNENDAAKAVMASAVLCSDAPASPAP